MPLKNSVGHMYHWVTHTHAHLGGECEHHCVYCYVDHPRFGRAPRYSGPIRLLEDEFRVKYDEKTLTRKGGVFPGTIFVEHMGDINGPSVTPEMKHRIIDHCRDYPANTYVLQSKNPRAFVDLVDILPRNCIIGTTIETNRDLIEIGDAPPPSERHEAMKLLDWPRTFVTIEPVLDFDVDVLAQWIADIAPEFLNLGADSKSHSLPEPSIEKIEALVAALAEHGIELREKHNLQRLRRKEAT